MSRPVDDDKLTEPGLGGGGSHPQLGFIDPRTGIFYPYDPTLGFGAGVGPLQSGIPNIAPGLMGGPMFGSGIPGGGGGGGGGPVAAAPSVLDRILRWLRPGLAGASLLGGATANRGGQQIPPELQRILDLQAQRMEAQGPLFEATAQTAFNRLPTYATEGFAPPSLATAAGQVPPSTPDPNTPPGLQSLLRQQEIRMRTGDPILQAIQRLAQMRLPTGP